MVHKEQPSGPASFHACPMGHSAYLTDRNEELEKCFAVILLIKQMQENYRF